MEYTIVADERWENVVARVMELLAEEWQLQGGISCALSESDEYQYTLFAQAMVRKANGD